MGSELYRVVGSELYREVASKLYRGVGSKLHRGVSPIPGPEGRDRLVVSLVRKLNTSTTKFNSPVTHPVAKPFYKLVLWMFLVHWAYEQKFTTLPKPKPVGGDFRTLQSSNTSQSRRGLLCRKGTFKTVSTSLKKNQVHIGKRACKK